MSDGWEHLVIALSSASAVGIVSHMVNTFPTPMNKYGQWLLGVVQYAVGQRVAAENTLAGYQTGTYRTNAPPDGGHTGDDGKGMGFTQGKSE